MTKMFKQLLTLLLVFAVLCACTKEDKPKADIIYTNGNIWTVDQSNERVSAVAIQNGKIIAAGSDQEMNAFRSEQTTLFDLEGNFMMPGFIEGHGHFLGFGNSLLKLNFLDSKSWDEIVEMVAKAAKDLPEGTWIEGRG